MIGQKIIVINNVITTINTNNAANKAFIFILFFLV